VAAPDAQTLQAALNDIYRQAIVSWEVSVDRSLEQYAGGIEMPDNLSSDRPYCATMEAVIKAFKEQAKPDRKTRYIFLVKGFATGSNTDMGYMPFANQYGFVKAPGLSDAQIARTVAHELGHGAFGLKHTFDPEYGVSDNPQITPALNLMGYNDQVHLAKFQWDIIHQHSGETAFDSTDAVMMKGNDAALVFIETEGVGHTCIGLYTTNGLEIYTYGRYLGSDIPSSGSLAPIGDGILVWYKTEVDVNAYINLHLNKGPSAKVYMVYLNNSSLIEQYLQTKWNDGKDLPENIMETINGVKTIIPNKYYGFGKAIGKYIITTNNCTTITVEALKIGGFDVMKEAINQPTPKDDFWAPSILETYLNYFKNNANKYRVYEITEQFKSK
jgi:hypothetical protein